MVDVSVLARAGDVRALQEHLDELDVPAVVDELERVDSFSRAVAFRTLSKDRALAVFEDLDPPLQRELVAELRDDGVANLVAAMDPDDRAGLLDELPASVARRLLSGLSPAEQEVTTALLGYPPESAGRRMTPAVVTLDPAQTVAEALEHVRRQGRRAETVYLMAVVGSGRSVTGVVSLRRLLFTDPAVQVSQVMVEPITVRADEDQEVAARLVRDHGLVALPVVDDEGRLLGVFTVDDAMRVLEAEESEDIARSGGTEPLRRPYLSASVLGLMRSRILWLLVLIAAATLTVNVLEFFEDTLAEVVTLALFVPLLIGTAGNTGAQAATTVVRAMAVGDVRFSDLPRVVGREAAVGVLLGGALAVAGFLPATFVAGPQIALVLALALVAVCTLATAAGSFTPMVARRLGLDPAVVSAPFITTFVDASGLIVYFLIARAVLGL
ncbi:MAG: magnesium transporter [Nocardioides sp.]|nr:magnesium transporter [Nocardioides sp.]